MPTKTAKVSTTGKEFLHHLNRSLNTMEPDKIPRWAMSLADGVRDDDEISITVTRNEPETVHTELAENTGQIL